MVTWSSLVFSVFSFCRNLLAAFLFCSLLFSSLSSSSIVNWKYYPYYFSFRILSNGHFKLFVKSHSYKKTFYTTSVFLFFDGDEMGTLITSSPFSNNFCSILQRISNLSSGKIQLDFEASSDAFLNTSSLISETGTSAIFFNTRRRRRARTTTNCIPCSLSNVTSGLYKFKYSAYSFLDFSEFTLHDSLKGIYLYVCTSLSLFRMFYYLLSKPKVKVVVYLYKFGKTPYKQWTLNINTWTRYQQLKHVNSG